MSPSLYCQTGSLILFYETLPTCTALSTLFLRFVIWLERVTFLCRGAKVLEIARRLKQQRNYLANSPSAKVGDFWYINYGFQEAVGSLMPRTWTRPKAALAVIRFSLRRGY